MCTRIVVGKWLTVWRFSKLNIWFLSFQFIWQVYQFSLKYIDIQFGWREKKTRLKATIKCVLCCVELRISYISFGVVIRFNHRRSILSHKSCICLSLFFYLFPIFFWQVIILMKGCGNVDYMENCSNFIATLIKMFITLYHLVLCTQFNLQINAENKLNTPAVYKTNVAWGNSVKDVKFGGFNLVLALYSSMCCVSVTYSSRCNTSTILWAKWKWKKHNKFSVLYTVCSFIFRSFFLFFCSKTLFVSIVCFGFFS